MSEQQSHLALVSNPRAPQIDSLERPSYAVYEGPTTADGKLFRAGTWYHGIKHTNGEEPGQPYDLWICAPLHVDAETVNSDDGSVGRLLRFRHRGRVIEYVMPMEALAGKGEEVLKALMRQGLEVEYHQRRHVPAYIASHHGLSKILATTTKPGWHDQSGAFVLPNRIIGGENVRYQDTGKGANLYTAKGTLEGWRTEVAPYCEDNPVLILAICCALAGPLLAKVGVNGGGVHLVGDSSSGKSLAQAIAASVWGNPGVFAASWDMSRGGIEIEASSRNDTVLILDEIKRADPKRVQEMAYAIANGTGKGTMTREREGRPKLYWRVLALSSGERSLSEHAAISGNAAHAGAELRMVDVNAGTRTHRAFDELHGMTGEAFHRMLTAAASRHYGHIGPAFVTELVKETEPEVFYQRFGEVRSRFDAEGSQAGRVADRFAIIGLAGELAIEHGLLPWASHSAADAGRLLFREWVARVGDGNAEDRQILTAIADFIALHGDSRFSDISALLPNPNVRHRAGYFEIEDGKRLYLFNRASLAEAAAGYGRDRILRALDTYGVLAKTDSGRRQKNYRLPGGGSTRFFVIDPDKLDIERSAT
ncbi:DUF927 domain-containing protein [Halomonas caseinilytica]|uniref:DUF927 domain-containing protein n=1 Tax=Halomonas caseinilytica TaxID=438744 RepID=UPI0007E59361|nr:DUF927 domain-containing protein [Halomonas caseinilytica]SEM10547.1 Uncharcterized protein, DUF927 family [Halomonas caseinilytica]